jgi:signal transduction histidine kinase
MAAVERQASDRSVRLELSSGVDGSRVEADAEWLTTAIRSLLERAIEAAPAGDAVTVEVRSGPAGESLVVGHGGAGFDADEQSRLLDPVGPSNRERGHGNLRLELAIADCVARRHRGALVATSEGPESGARYELRLPPASSG